MRTIVIDGSYGEGGGQILRTALSLSCITRYPLSLVNIRKDRKRPGLMRQHLTCVNAIAEICGASVSGNDIGSTELSFTPGNTRAGNYLFDIQTAGSCSLVFQTLLPPLLFAGADSVITIRGGTHVPFSPPYHYLPCVLLPMLTRIGIRTGASIRRYGFYPKGGGEVAFRISPAGKISGLNVDERGGLTAIRGISAAANLPSGIAERQRAAVLKRLSPLHAEMEVLKANAYGAGTFVFLTAEYQNTIAGFSALGERGKPAEDVGREAAEQCRDFHDSAACADPHLADQIVVYLSLAEEDSVLTTSRITQHLMTNLHVIRQFLNIRYDIEGAEDSPGTVRIAP